MAYIDKRERQPTTDQFASRLCITCGLPKAYFGYNCRPGSEGDWYCFAHRPDAPQNASQRTQHDNRL